MNYSTFFVILLGVGTLVFIGIIGAAWMSAVDQHDQSKPISPVGHPTEKPMTSVTGTTKSAISNVTVSAPMTDFYTNTTKITYPEINTLSTVYAIAYNNEYYSTPAVEYTENESQIFKRKPKTGLTTKVDFKPSDTELVNSSCELTKLFEEKGDIKPEYKNSNSCLAWLIQYEEGYSVDITIEKLDLDGHSEDFLLISYDQDIAPDEGNPLFTWKLKEQKTYRIPNKGTAYILFVTNESVEDKPQGFHLQYRRQGELTSTTSSTPSPFPENNNETIVMTIKCYVCTKLTTTITVPDETEEAFKILLAEEANKFCDDNNIALKEEVRAENVFIASKWPCVQTWPEQETCIHMKVAITVANDGPKHELTKDNLEKLWDNWDGAPLQDHAMEKLGSPNYKTHVTIWTLSFVLIIVLLIVVIFLFFQMYPNYSDRKDKQEPEKSSVCLEVPPIFMNEHYDDPEILPYYNCSVNTETSTDDMTVAYGQLPPYSESPYKYSAYNAHKDFNSHVDNKNFLPITEEDEDEILNRNTMINSIRKEQISD